MVLVRSDTAVPSANRSVLAYHDIFGDLVEQSGGDVSLALRDNGKRVLCLPEIVGYYDDTAGEGIDSIGQ